MGYLSRTKPTDHGAASKADTYRPAHVVVVASRLAASHTLPAICLLLLCLLLIFTTGCFQKKSKLSSVPPPGSLSADRSHELMVAALQQIATEAPDQNIFVGDRLARSLRSERKTFNASTPRLQRWLKTYQLAKAELHLGKEIESLQLFDEALNLIRDHPRQVKPEILRQFYFDTAVAYLRWAETQNCCRNNSPEACILPIRGDGVHQDQDGSRRAIQWLTVVLQETTTDEPMHLAARWLLNIAFMTLGEYPPKVPTAHLIPGLESNSSHVTAEWKNIASRAGVATFSLAGGAIADDFDNDGHMDLIVSSSDPRESLKVFWNQGDGTFTDGTEAANVGKILGGLNLTQTDYDNDGLVDVFVMRGGWLGAAGQHPNSLLKNNGDRTFTDVTFNTGLASQNLPTQTAAWADFDLDGDLDVYIGNESSTDLPAPSQLFRNEGNGTFTNVADQAGVTNQLLAKAVAWGDFDGDRYPDLYVSNYRGANRLYHNRGDGTFEDIAGPMHVDGPMASFPTWFCDVNNDGHLDLFVAAYAGGIAEIAASWLEKSFDRDATLPRIYLNDGKGQFHDEAEQRGLVRPIHPMGANFGDLHNSGFVDFYFGTGWPEYHELMPNVLYQNKGNAFVDITAAARVGHLQKGHAVAMADVDNDGDLDLFEQMGGFVPGDKFYDVLYQNPTRDKRWLKIKLIGTESNRAAIGARIHLRVRDAQDERSIYRYVSSGGSFGASPLEQHLGLGSSAEIVSLNVFWPRTGKTDSYQNVTPNSRLRIIEGAKHPVVF